jgi:hypothetical protein
MKRTARVAVKVAAGIAAVVFILANPLMGHGGIAFFLSIPLLLLCFLVWLLVDGRKSGYWPDKPTDK